MINWKIAKEYEDITYKKADGVARVAFNRPEVRNAFRPTTVFELYEALVDAGRKRAQPIVMTTVAMVAGMVPTAISLSGDAAWRQPMGVMVIGGLVVSTIMTLILVPAGFSLADDIEKWMGKFFGKYLLADPKAGSTGPAPEVQPAE